MTFLDKLPFKKQARLWGIVTFSVLLALQFIGFIAAMAYSVNVGTSIAFMMLDVVIFGFLIVALIMRNKKAVYVGTLVLFGYNAINHFANGFTGIFGINGSFTAETWPLGIVLIIYLFIALAAIGALVLYLVSTLLKSGSGSFLFIVKVLLLAISALFLLAMVFIFIYACMAGGNVWIMIIEYLIRAGAFFGIYLGFEASEDR